MFTNATRDTADNAWGCLSSITRLLVSVCKCYRSAELDYVKGNGSCSIFNNSNNIESRIRKNKVNWHLHHEVRPERLLS